jgi:putative peptidoglycan lipid II flippase
MFKLLSSKTNTVGKTALLLTIFLLSSSVLAVVRDKIFSTKFGAGEILDTYIAAFKIPDLIFLLVGTLISSFVIIPLLEKEEQQGRQLQAFINKLFFTFSALITLVSALVFLMMPVLAYKIFPGFSDIQIENLVSMSRVMLLSPIFISLASVFASVNQKNSYFLPTALTGVFYNLSIILGTIFLYPIFGFSGVVFGVIFGAFLYLLLQLPPIFKEKKFISKIEFFNIKEIKKIIIISAPRSVALVVADILFIFLIAQATLLGDGSVTLLNFSLNIFLVPISIIAVSYSVAVFPKLAKAYAQGNMLVFKDLSRDIISRILFFAIPVSFFFVVFSKSIVGFLLGSEKFGLPDISKTGILVSVFALGIVFQTLLVMMVRIFYAMGRT